MKGVVLAGGLGTRMYPLTKVTNKHLLPIYNKPMIYYPIRTLVNAGIDEILIVTGGNSAGDFLRLLGNGKEFGLRHLNYTYQEGEGGIAAALSLAEYFTDNDKIVVILGDNIIERNIRSAVESFRAQKEGARILLKEVSDPQRFGVPVFEGERIVRIDEKPLRPRLQLCRDRDLHVRSPGVRFHQDAEALGTGGTGDHRREQLLYPRGEDRLGRPGWVVDRCGDLRFPPVCGQHGGEDRGEQTCRERPGRDGRRER